MKVLIFGSRGLVGRSLSKTLNNSDFVTEVIQSTREDTNLEDKNSIINSINKNEPDYVVNCAAKVGGIYANNKYRVDFLMNNLKINLNLFDAVKEFNNVGVINLGSSCIYPLDAKNPIKEEYFMSGKLEPTNSPYAIGKIVGIELGKEISKQFGNNVINLMPTNLYGPFDNFSEMDSHVIPGMMYKMHKAKVNNSKIFKIWGTGKPLREFMYVDDLSNCIEFLIMKKPNIDLINVGSGKEISIYDLAILMKEVVGYTGEIKTDLNMPDGNPRKLLDSTIINKLGWTHSTNLKDGLIKTYDWFLKNI
jgi:GDP-L-fucose synthase